MRLIVTVTSALALWTLGMPARFHGAVRRALAQTTPVGLFVAGGLVGLCTVPCSGAIYLGVLALGGMKVTWWLLKNGVRNPKAAIDRLRGTGR